jgi:hypothetical protein
MAISAATVKSLMIALSDAGRGNEVTDALNAGIAAASQDLFCLPALIVATNVSQTVDFAALAVGDKVVVIPASAGNSHFVTVATAGTLGEAAVVGSLYVVLRAYAAPAASAVKF